MTSRSSAPAGGGDHESRLGKCQASKNVTARVSPGASSKALTSDAIAIGWENSRFSKIPSSQKSSQKSSSPLRQIPSTFHVVRWETSSPASSIRANASVPKSGELGASCEPQDKPANPPELAVIILRFAVGPISTDQTVQVAADRSTNGPVSRVGNNIAQNRERPSAGLSIARHQRIEGLQANLKWHIRVAQNDLAKRIGRFKAAIFEAGQAVIAFRTPPSAFVLRGIGSAFQHSHHWRVVLALYPQSKETVLRGIALSGSIDDLPIAQIAAPAQGNGAGADAAQRQSDA